MSDAILIAMGNVSNVLIQLLQDNSSLKIKIIIILQLQTMNGLRVVFLFPNCTITPSLAPIGSSILEEILRKAGQLLYDRNTPAPENFTATNQTITYLYDATGRKVQKTVTNDTDETVTDYLNGFQYEKVNGGPIELKFFPHAEGYVNNTVIDSTNVYNYVYQYKDHLGNVRMSWTQDLIEEGEVVIMEENHYYPYGLKHTKYNADTWSFIKGGIPVGVAIAPVVNLPNQYKYNGKEYQDELGMNMYDYGARNYDPAIGRWMNIDPLAEMSRRYSPYTYAVNNPVFFIDPDGMMQAPNGGYDVKDPLEFEDLSYLKNRINYIGNSVDGGPIDPPKPGEGTRTGNMQGHLPNNAPDGKDITILLDEVVIGKGSSSSNGSSSGSNFHCPACALSNLSFNITDGVTIWGKDKSGNTTGLKGTTKYSIESDELPNFGSPNGLNSTQKGLNSFGIWWLKFAHGATDAGGLLDRGTAIEATINNTNTEPIVNRSVNVITYTFNLRDSTVSLNSKPINFKGAPNAIKRKVDSVTNMNNSRREDKNAWMKSWAK